MRKKSMEEPKPGQTTPQTQTPNPDPNPPNAAQNLPPPLPQQNKRALDQNGHIQNSNYFKMRAVLKDLRPHFIEVLRTPVFHDCKAAREIQEQMKLLMDLYKEMTAETITTGKCNNIMPEGPLSSKIPDGQKPGDQQPPADKVFVETPQEKPILLGNLSEKQRSEDGRIQGTYIVGGSAFGWNFVTYPGSEAVYYGRTKEMFRTANIIPPENPIVAKD